MKIKLTFLAAVLACTPMTVQAGLLTGDAQIEKIIRIEPSACAVEVGLLEDIDILGLEDRLVLGDRILARLGSILGLLDLDLFSGDSILLGSDSFVELTGITADLMLDDTDCDGLSPNVSLRLLNVLNVVIDTVLIDPDLTDGFAQVRVGVESGDFELVSLDEELVVVSNAMGDQAEIEAEIGAASSDTSGAEVSGDVPGNPQTGNFAGGCSLGAASNLTSTLYGWLFLMTLGLSWRRMLLAKVKKK